MGEKAVLSVYAHVFQIDPNTKKNWLPTSGSSIKVSYYYDLSRKTYRIIALEKGKPLINSTVTAHMTFTKTSPKFGQWSDHRASTVYGLGFSTEDDILTFSDKFMEAKAAAKELLDTRLNKKKPTTDANPSGSDSPDQISPTLPSSPPVSSSSITATSNTITNTPDNNNNSSINGSGGGGEDSDSKEQLEVLKLENNKLKVALANSAQNVKKWESELQTLRNNNTMLTTALEESTEHVGDWKIQLQKYKDECDTLRKKVNDGEGNSDEIKNIKEENSELKEVLSAVQIDLEQKAEESSQKDILISDLKDKVNTVNKENGQLSTKVKELQEKLSTKEKSYSQKYSVFQQKSKEIESQLASLLSLQKELSKQFIS